MDSKNTDPTKFAVYGVMILLITCVATKPFMAEMTHLFLVFHHPLLLPHQFLANKLHVDLALILAAPTLHSALPVMTLAMHHAQPAQKDPYCVDIKNTALTPHAALLATTVLITFVAIRLFMV